MDASVKIRITLNWKMACFQLSECHSGPAKSETRKSLLSENFRIIHTIAWADKASISAKLLQIKNLMTPMLQTKPKLVIKSRARTINIIDSRPKNQSSRLQRLKRSLLKEFIKIHMSDGAGIKKIGANSAKS